MKNRILKIVICSFVVLAAMLSNVKISLASGGLSISSSVSKIEEGKTFTVTVKASNNVFVEGLSISCNGGTVVKGLGKKSLDKGESTTAMIKLTSDSVIVTVHGTSANYDTEAESFASDSCTVKEKITNSDTGSSSNNTTKPSKPSDAKPKEEDKRSKENNLLSLTVSESSLSPKFSANTTKYQVDVAANVSKIILSAKAKDTKAKISGTGEKKLNVGSNTFTVQCTAENGSVKTYTVIVNVDEKPLVFTKYNGKTLGVVRNLNDVVIPKSFEKTTVQIDNQTVTAYQSNQLDKTIVFMTDENNEKAFYLFEEGKGITSIFNPVSILGRNVYLIDLSKDETIKEGMKYQELTIDNQKLMGWVYDDAQYSQYSLFTVMNEFGDKVTYQHEKSENSLQLYVEKVVEEKTDNTLSYVFMGTTALFAITSLALFINHRRFKKKSISAIKDYYETRNID